MEDTTPATPPSTAHQIFLGRFGLRAGWSILLFIPLFIAFLAILSVTTLAVTGKLKQTVHDAISHQHDKATTTPPSAHDIRPKSTVINEALSFAATALATLALALIERRRMAVYGIGRRRLFDILPGALWGLLTLSLLVEVLHATHVLVFDSQALHGPAITLFGLKWLLAFFLVGCFEEYLNRGFLQYTLTRGLIGLGEAISSISNKSNSSVSSEARISESSEARISESSEARISESSEARISESSEAGISEPSEARARAIAFWIAAILMSIFFGAGHLFNPGENPVGILMVFVAGIVFSYALWRTGSLWWGIGFHMAWDWAQSFLYGVPDSGGLSAGRLFLTHPTGRPLFSGGPDGPEGSLYVIPTMLLVALLIRFTTTKAPQPPLEPQSS